MICREATGYVEAAPQQPTAQRLLLLRSACAFGAWGRDWDGVGCW
jgi:hypothetical protein